MDERYYAPAHDQRQRLDDRMYGYSNRYPRVNMSEARDSWPKARKRSEVEGFLSAEARLSHLDSRLLTLLEVLKVNFISLQMPAHASAEIETKKNKRR